MGVDFIIGDVTTLQADAVVNVINYELKDGGLVNYAIHRAAGPELKEYSGTFTPWLHCGGMATNRKKNGWQPAISDLWNWQRSTTAGRLRFL